MVGGGDGSSQKQGISGGRERTEEGKKKRGMSEGREGGREDMMEGMKEGYGGGEKENDTTRAVARHAKKKKTLADDPTFLSS
jgi:hypothetical protein